MTVLDPALHTLESALEAWASCNPNGYTMQEAAVDPLLAQIACLIPGSASSPRTAQMLRDMFLPVSSNTGAPIFQQMLRPRDGMVHFIYFWHAFSKAANVLTKRRCKGRSCKSQQKGLGMEMEFVRDEVLRLLESLPECRSVKNCSLSSILSRATTISVAPEFWVDAVALLKYIEDDISLHQLTSFFISWLHEAIALQNRDHSSSPLHSRKRVVSVGLPTPHQEHDQGAVPTLSKSATADYSSSHGNRRRALSMPGVASKRRAVNCTQTSRELALQGCMPVYLHIYDVSQEDSVRRLNKVLAHQRAPIKFGGVFHAGVEVNGLEFAFGLAERNSMSGITCTLPRSNPQHQYRQTVRLGPTTLPQAALGRLISELIEEYPGHDYDLLRRNCCHFADDFCRRLGVGGIPRWVRRLAKVGAMVDSAMHAVTKRRLVLDDLEGCV